MDPSLSPSATLPGITPERAATPDAVAKADRYLWGVYIFLLLISVVELYSASSREVSSSGTFGVLGPVVRHIMTLVLGLACVIGLSRVHYTRFIPVIPVFALVSALLMVLVLFTGQEVNGARRSLTFFITIQPSEMIKLAAPLMIALVLARTQSRRNAATFGAAGVWVSVTVVVGFCALLITQGMTNTLLLMCISIAMLVIGGSRWWTLIKVALFYVGVLILLTACAVIFMPREQTAQNEKLHREIVELKQSGALSDWQVFALDRFGERGRVATWILRFARHDGGDDAVPIYDRKITDKNAQEMFAYMAQAHGGLIGVGPGNSRETSRLPLAFSDYIFSIIVEETGLIGACAVLFAYLFLLGRAFSISSRCTRALPALLVIGMAVTVVMQALFHMAIVTGVFPVSGQPLPLISKGGCSILMVSCAFGVMLSVSRYAVRAGAKKSAVRREMQALPDDLTAENPTLIK